MSTTERARPGTRPGRSTTGRPPPHRRRARLQRRGHRGRGARPPQPAGGRPRGGGRRLDRRHPPRDREVAAGPRPRAARRARAQPGDVGGVLHSLHRHAPAHHRRRDLGRRPHLHDRRRRPARAGRARGAPADHAPRRARRPPRAARPVGLPALQAVGQPAAVGVGVAVGRRSAAGRRVRLPDLPGRRPGQRPRLLPGVQVLRDGRGGRRAVAPRATRCATTSWCRCRSTARARRWWTS